MTKFIQYDLSPEGLAYRKDLPERVSHFIKLMDQEPCANMSEEHPGFSDCIVMSKASSMCPACRLSLYFYQTVIRMEED